MNKARITYRLDAREHEVVPVRREPAGREEESVEFDRNAEPVLNEFTTDFGAWSSPFDPDTDRLEKLIRESGPRLDRSEREKPQSGFEPAPRDEPPLRPGYSHLRAEAGPPRFAPEIVDESYRAAYGRGGRLTWLKMIASVSGAIVTGLLIGMFALYLLGGGKVQDVLSGHAFPSPDSTALPANSSAAGEEAPTDVVSGPQAAETDGQASLAQDEAMLTVSIPAQTYYMLQNGVFSTLQSADQAQKQLAASGLPAMVDTVGHYAVFAGIASNQDDAEYLRTVMAGKQLEAYVKTFDLPQVDRVSWDGDAAAISDYFTEGRKLVRIMSGLTLLYLQQDPPQRMDDAAYRSLQDEHQAWTAAAARIAGSAPDNIADLVSALNQAMNTAEMALTEYNKNPSEAPLWQSQSALLRYVVTENEIWGKLRAQS